MRYINNSLFKQFFGYIFNGCIATATHYSVLIFLVEIASILPPVPASAIGAISGATVGFLLNSKYVFATSKKNNQKIVYLKYLTMAGSGALLNTLLLSAIIKIFAIHYLIAQVIATIIVIFWNFTACKVWVFKEKKYAN